MVDGMVFQSSQKDHSAVPVQHEVPPVFVAGFDVGNFIHRYEQACKTQTSDAGRQAVISKYGENALAMVEAMALRERQRDSQDLLRMAFAVGLRHQMAIGPVAARELLAAFVARINEPAPQRVADE